MVIGEGERVNCNSRRELGNISIVIKHLRFRVLFARLEMLLSANVGLPGGLP